MSEASPEVSVFSQPLRHFVRGRTAELAAITAAVALPLPFLGDSFYAYVVTLALVYAGSAVGLSAILGVANQFHLGQAALMGIGGFAAAIFSERIGAELPYELLIAAGVAGVVGAVIGTATLRLKGLFFALATLALVLVMSSLSSNWITVTHGELGFPGIAPLTLAGYGLSARQTYLMIGAFFVIQASIWVCVKRSTYWSALKLIGDRDYLASCVGIPVYLYRVVTFIVVSVAAAVWGVLYAHVVGYIDPLTFGLSLTIALIMMVVLGGLGSLWGTLIGAAVLVAIQERLATVHTKPQLYYGAILLVAVLLFPKGIVPSIERYGRRFLRSHLDGIQRDLPVSKGSAGHSRARSRLLKFDGASLVAQDVAVAFGGVRALAEASLTADTGSIEGLIGPNGSGKTTMLNYVSGVVRQGTGSVLLDGLEIGRLPPHRVAALGLMRTFQTPQCVLSMTGEENALLGWHMRRKTKLRQVVVGLPSAVREERQQHAEVAQLCAQLDLLDVYKRPASELSTGDQRFIEIVRALGTQPRVLFLDEPATGLTGVERERLTNVLLLLRTAGLTLVVIDHDMDFLLQIADHVTVLNRGSNIAEGDPQTIRSNQAVIDAYFGAPEHAQAH